MVWMIALLKLTRSVMPGVDTGHMSLEPMHPPLDGSLCAITILLACLLESHMVLSENSGKIGKKTTFMVLKWLKPHFPYFSIAIEIWHHLAGISSQAMAALAETRHSTAHPSPPSVTNRSFSLGLGCRMAEMNGYQTCIHWIGLRENLQETIDFPIKYGIFL